MGAPEFISSVCVTGVKRFHSFHGYFMHYNQQVLNIYLFCSIGFSAYQLISFASRPAKTDWGIKSTEQYSDARPLISVISG